MRFQIELYPYRDKFLMLSLSGRASAYQAAFKDFKAAKSSMGVLNPKRKKR